jgi:GTP-binding protein YchF
MSLSVGIVGLPNVGKSTLFNALMQREIAKVGRHPFTTVTPNKGVVVVPDQGMTALFKLIKAKNKSVEVRPATIEFVDIAGLVKGAAEGAGLGNRFLAHIREVDLILHVLREFDNPQVAHVSGQIDPVSDASTADLELILADFETVAKAISEREKKAKSDKPLAAEVAVLRKIKQVLGEGKPAIAAGLADEEEKLVASFNLLSLKPVVFVLNISEKHLDEEDYSKEKLPEGVIIPICVKLEAELYELNPQERKDLMDGYRMKKAGLEEVIRTAYQTLGLITFYTIKGGKIVTAWPVKKGTTALMAADTIHTDFARRFIKAEVIDNRRLIETGSWQAAKESGLIRTEGKEYPVQDGEVIEFIIGK